MYAQAVSGQTAAARRPSPYLPDDRVGAAGFADLFSRLNLPRSGYDFSGLVTKPLSMSDLGRAIRHLSPDEALKRVLELRKSDEARDLRQEWAERLWATDPHAIEGYGQSIKGVTVHGDIIQVMGVPAGSVRKERRITESAAAAVQKARDSLLEKLEHA